MSNFKQLFTPGAQAPLLVLGIPFFESGTWTVPKNGEITLRLMGGGGSGGRGSGSISGGYAASFGAPGGSGAWGVLRRRVVAGQVLQIIIGAGGPGGPGGDSYLQIDGVEIARAPGGSKGQHASDGGATTATPPTAAPTGFDFGRPGHGAPAGNFSKRGAAPRLDLRTFDLTAANAAPISHPYSSAASSADGLGAAWQDWGGLPAGAFVGGVLTMGGQYPATAPGFGGGASPSSSSNITVAGGPGYGYLVFVGDD